MGEERRNRRIRERELFERQTSMEEERRNISNLELFIMILEDFHYKFGHLFK